MARCASWGRGWGQGRNGGESTLGYFGPTEHFKPRLKRKVGTSMMKLFLWILLGLAVAGLTFWAIVIEGPESPALVSLVVVVFTASPIGAFWMLYVAIRYETRPLPMVLVAFIPFSFLWYYFERVRPGRLTRGDGAAR